jgi:NAD(P)-dependent dehydrogenase (short-subunit alcohol dehydrogenase family)
MSSTKRYLIAWFFFLYRYELKFCKCFQYLEHSKTTHALGRVGNVAEVASVITFLASSGASYITGAHIPVDGGRHAMCPR